MTQSLPVPTREQWKAAQPYLRSTAEHLNTALNSSFETYDAHSHFARLDFQDALRALGFTLQPIPFQADEPARQPQGDLRERCKAVSDKLMRDGILRQGSPVDTLMAFVVAELEAAAAQPSREAALVKALQYISRMKVSVDHTINLMTLSAAMQIAIDVLAAYTPATPENANRGYSLDQCPGYQPDTVAMGDCFNCGHTRRAHAPVTPDAGREEAK